jgi:iron complex outermembrane receptor protein
VRFHKGSDFLAGASLLVVGLAFTAPSAVFAADASATEAVETNAAEVAPAEPVEAGSGDIVVTAERRVSSVQKVPVAVGVLGGDDLQRNGIKKLWDANGAIAGLYLPSYPSNMQYVSIRGIGTSDPGVFAAVGYYLDDVYLGRTFGRGAIDLPDLERVEVLRGPQGTLYGQNTTGGAIKFVSRDPSLTQPDNWVSLSAGNIGALEAHAYLSTPIVTDRLGASLAYSHRQNSGDTWNAYRHTHVDRLNVDQFRAKLRWSPSDRLDIVLSVDGTRDSSDNYISSPHNVPGGGKPRRIFANTDSEMHRNDLGQTLKITYKLDDHLTLKSITAHRRDHTDPHPWDQDALPEDYFGWNQRFTEKVLSQEFQLTGDYDRLNFTLGASIYDEKFDFNRLQWLNFAYTNLESHPTYRTYAIYGQGHYRVIGGLGITLGGRYNWEKQTFEAESYKSNVNRDRLATNYIVDGLKQKERGFTPKVGIDFQATRDLLAYASYTVGNKSGGFNRAAGTLQVASIPVAPEKVKTIEIGLKSSFFDRKLTLNIAAFRNKFTDYQATVTNPVINGSIVNGNVVVNAGAAITKGVELEASARPVNGLELRTAATILRTKFTEFLNPTGAANSDFTGNQVPYAPRFTFSGGFSWRVPLHIPGSLQLAGSVGYVKHNYTDIANTRAFRAQSQTYVNANLDYITGDGRWQFSINAKNLFNKTYVLGSSINPTLHTDTSSYNPPRTVLATVRYNFN